MGLDIVELMMDIEERFGIRLSDDRAERMRTVSDLYVYLLARTHRIAPVPCPTSRAFYHLRRTLIGELGVDRARVRPSARLRDLLPAEARGTAGPRLAAALGLPDLDPAPRGPTARAFRTALAAVTAGALLLHLLLNLLPGPPVPVAVTLLIWLLALLLVCELFGIFWLEWRCFNPVPVPKVQDLVVRLVARDRDRYVDQDAVEPVWADLVAILSEHTGVPGDQIRPEQRFEDLLT
jgi:hypothetical protein